MATEDQVIATLQRVSFTALTYYAEVAVDDAEFSLGAEAAWCLEPLGELDASAAADVLDTVQRVIVDPTAHRETFVALLKSLEDDTPDG